MATRQFDLTRFAASLRSSRRHASLAALIERHMHRASRYADLLHAEELTNLLLVLRGTAGASQSAGSDSDAVNAQGALLAQAIILYVRSTTHGDKGRHQQLNIRKALTPNQRRDHAEILEVRDRAIAHFDAEEKQDWHSDRLVLLKHDNGDWEYGSPYSRTIYRADVHLRLKSLLDTVVPYVKSANSQALNLLHNALDAAVRNDPSLEAEIDTVPFDRIAFYGSSPQAEEIGSILDKGDSGEQIWSAVSRSGNR